MIRISVKEWIEKIGPRPFIGKCLKYVKFPTPDIIANIIYHEDIPTNIDNPGDYTIYSENDKEDFILRMKIISGKLIRLKSFI